MFKALLLLILSSATCVHAQLLKDPEEAFLKAQQSGKEVLLIFSGSDWCIPCIQFNNKILADTAFQHFAQDKLVLLEADFPQRRRIPASLRSQYESLAAEFNPEGAFPRIVLLTPGKKLLAQVPFIQQSPPDFIAEVQQMLK
ncbi:thioredoxin family protein [Chitinophaga japonensis]|nr:thioredoxin family protein [Chitinophaga japonensis]